EARGGVSSAAAADQRVVDVGDHHQVAAVDLRGHGHRLRDVLVLVDRDLERPGTERQGTGQLGLEDAIPVGAHLDGLVGGDVAHEDVPEVEVVGGEAVRRGPDALYRCAHDRLGDRLAAVHASADDDARGGPVGTVRDDVDRLLSRGSGR